MGYKWKPNPKKKKKIWPKRRNYTRTYFSTLYFNNHAQKFSFRNQVHPIPHSLTPHLAPIFMPSTQHPKDLRLHYLFLSSFSSIDHPAKQWIIEIEVGRWGRRKIDHLLFFSYSCNAIKINSSMVAFCAYRSGTHHCCDSGTRLYFLVHCFVRWCW